MGLAMEGRQAADLSGSPSSSYDSYCPEGIPGVITTQQGLAKFITKTFHQTSNDHI